MDWKKIAYGAGAAVAVAVATTVVVATAGKVKVNPKDVVDVVTNMTPTTSRILKKRFH